MKKEDIEQGTREAGGFDATPEFLAKFAAIVASAERERLTDAAMKSAEKAVEVAVALEREACAKLADEWAVGWPHPSKVIALDIRARGQA